VRHLTTLVALVAALLVATAGPAAADPAGPTSYRSTVTDVSPEVDTLSVQVLGGDAFLYLEVAPGTEVVVPGYDEDPDASPYLRFHPDGTVEVNTRSPATYLNDARYGARDVEVPADADPLAPPVWQEVATGGSYAWHDHRIHFMSPSVPDQVDTDAGVPQPVLPWEVVLLVDGEPVTVTGELVWLPPNTPLLPGMVALVAAGLAFVATRPDRRLVPAVVGVGAVLGLAVGLPQTIGLPQGAVGPVLPVLLPAIGLGGAVLAMLLRRRDERSSTLLGLLSALPVIATALVQTAAFTAPTVPGPIPAIGVAAALGAALGLAVGALAGGAPSLVTPLTPE
jgi:hypothetical protein